MKSLDNITECVPCMPTTTDPCGWIWTLNPNSWDNLELLYEDATRVIYYRNNHKSNWQVLITETINNGLESYLDIRRFIDKYLKEHSHFHHKVVKGGIIKDGRYYPLKGEIRG